MAAAAIKNAINGVLPTTNGDTVHPKENGNGVTSKSKNGVVPRNYGFEKFDFPFEVYFCKLQPPDDHPELTHYDGFKPGEKTILRKGHIKEPGFRPLPCDMHYERDVAVKMRDGTVTYTDIFRPVTDEPVPVILPYSPYGKTGQGEMT